MNAQSSRADREAVRLKAAQARAAQGHAERRTRVLLVTVAGLVAVALVSAVAVAVVIVVARSGRVSLAAVKTFPEERTHVAGAVR